MNDACKSFSWIFYNLGWLRRVIATNEVYVVKKADQTSPWKVF